MIRKQRNKETSLQSRRDMRNKIDRRLYAKEYEDDCDEILCYGVTF